MIVWPILIPFLGALAAFLVPSNRWRPWLVPAFAAAHLAVTVFVGQGGGSTLLGDWLHLDPLGRYFLGFISLYFFLLSLYVPGYLACEGRTSNRVLCACLLAALGTMSAVTLAHHLGLMWIAVEATTLATAPCIYFEHNARSLEATWKYLIICSVGIAIALLGLFFLAYASLYGGEHSSLLICDLARGTPHLSTPWLHVAFILVLVGFGTKMGLAPMHTWLPDAHSESPAVVSALLSGALLNCAFLGILRVYQIMVAAGEAAYAQSLMLPLGLFSMTVAAVFLVRQRDIKRLVAYSSVEHMGMIAFGVGIGGAGLSASLLHVVHNGLTKGVLFLAAGNIYHSFGTKSTDQLHGVLRRLPWSGALFLAGFFAITGSPMFAPFVSEYQMISTAFATGRLIPALIFLLLLLIVFFGMGITVIRFSFGPAPEIPGPNPHRDSMLTVGPIVILMALVVLLGVYTPPIVEQWLVEAAAQIVHSG